jgi:peptidoglycan-N-acetylglucosamine deacetylase
MDAHKVSRTRQWMRAGLAAVLPRRSFLVRGPRTSRSVCLTFDDGPHPVYTPQYLDLLAAHKATATFFVVGQNVERFPDLVRRMVAEGHTVGNHTYSHPRREELTARRMAEDVRRGADVIRGVCGTTATLYRPPRGKVTAADLCGLVWSRQTVVLWNRDPKDFARRSGQEVINWFRAHPPESGDLILLHDVHPHSLAVLPEVIGLARRRGFEFASVSRWTG